MIDRNHPAVKAAHFASLGKSTVSGQTWADALTAALPHLESATLENIARLRDTPAGRDLIREGIAAARNLEWMQPRVTPGGRVYHPAIPGDQLRAVCEDALAREAMQNMRESEQGRELMAEAWQVPLIELAVLADEYEERGHEGRAETLRSAMRHIMQNNPYRKDDA